MNIIQSKYATVKSLQGNSPLALTNMDIVKRIFAKTEAYCTGKYSSSIKRSETPVNFPIWHEDRSDKEGAYVSLRCIDERTLTDEEQRIYNHLVEVWNS